MLTSPSTPANGADILDASQRSPMRCLFISDKIPYPLNTGGNQRVYHLLNAVAGIAETTFLCPTSQGLESEELRSLRALYKESVRVPKESFAWKRDTALSRPRRLLRSIARHLHPTQPEFLQLRSSTQGRQTVARLCDSGSFDVIFGERLFSLGLLPRPLNRQMVIDLDDLEYDKLRRKLDMPSSRILFTLDYLEYLKLARLERSLTKEPCQLLVCSEKDKQLLGNGANIHVIPNGVDFPKSPGPPSHRQDPTLLFVGWMSYPANIDAVTYFARDVMPMIVRNAPTAKFVIVGRDPSPEVERLHDGSHVFVTGKVDSVEPFLRDASVVVAPFRFGGGTRIKILEAFAHLRPVVSTTIGAEGLGANHGEHLLLADTSHDIARECLLLLADPRLRLRLANNAYDLAREKYQWKNIEKSLQDLLRTVACAAA